MLMPGSTLLSVADQHDFAVPAFNVSDYAMLNGLFAISEERQAPFIVAIHPDELSHIGADVLPAIVHRAHRSSVPVAIHFDHGTTYEHMLLGIRTGFTSLMLDGSMHAFADNVARTRAAVRAAHAVGVSVEGELGTIGTTVAGTHYDDAPIIYTDPDDAVRFVAETGVDSLAVAIGTSHGIYPKGMKPELKLDLLERIKGKVGIPLVLHGGSNNPDDEIAAAVKLGINKINISSDIKVAYHGKLREVLADADLREPNVIQPDAVAAMQEVAAQKIDLFDAAGKAELY